MGCDDHKKFLTSKNVYIYISFFINTIIDWIFWWNLIDMIFSNTSFLQYWFYLRGGIIVVSLLVEMSTILRCLIPICGGTYICTSADLIQAVSSAYVVCLADGPVSSLGCLLNFGLNQPKIGLLFLCCVSF